MERNINMDDFLGGTVTPYLTTDTNAPVLNPFAQEIAATSSRGRSAPQNRDRHSYPLAPVCVYDSGEENNDGQHRSGNITNRRSFAQSSIDQSGWQQQSPNETQIEPDTNKLMQMLRENNVSLSNQQPTPSTSQQQPTAMNEPEEASERADAAPLHISPSQLAILNQFFRTNSSGKLSQKNGGVKKTNNLKQIKKPILKPKDATTPRNIQNILAKYKRYIKAQALNAASVAGSAAPRTPVTGSAVNKLVQAQKTSTPAASGAALVVQDLAAASKKLIKVLSKTCATVDNFNTQFVKVTENLQEINALVMNSNASSSSNVMRGEVRGERQNNAKMGEALQNGNGIAETPRNSQGTKRSSSVLQEGNSNRVLNRSEIRPSPVEGSPVNSNQTRREIPQPPLVEIVPGTGIYVPATCLAELEQSNTNNGDLAKILNGVFNRR